MRAAGRIARGAALGLALAFAAPAPGAAQTAPDAFSAAGFVNGLAITNFDVEQRARLLGLGREGDAPREVAFESMIESRLKRAAAEDAGIALAREDVEQGLARFAAAQGADGARGLEARLRREGVSLEATRRFVETELMWSALIGRDFGPQTEVGDAELDAEIAARGLDRAVSYSLGEISIPGATPAAALAEAQSVLAEYRGGADFEALARRHSRSPTARQGGRVGWVPQDRIPPAVAEAVAGLAPGETTEPLPVQGGAVILALFDRREEARELSAEDRERLRARIVEQRLARRAEGRLAELKAEAHVERR